MNRPIAAGTFYPSNKDKLIKQLGKCFSSIKGKGFFLEKTGLGKKVYGIIAPHAGYTYSGTAAAMAYNAIKANKGKTFVLLAPDHNGYCFSPTTTREDFETPLGVVKTSKELVEKLLKKCNFLKQGIIREHAVEVQLPFLQYMFKEDFKIIPIIVPSPKYCKELGKAVKEICRDAVLIASSDFTHYGSVYGYAPFNAKDAKAEMKKLDLNAIKFIERLDAGGFLDYIERTGATICGQYAIAAAIEAVKAKKAELLTYYTSGDVSGDYSFAVGYAAVAFS